MTKYKKVCRHLSILQTNSGCLHPPVVHCQFAPAVAQQVCNFRKLCTAASKCLPLSHLMGNSARTTTYLHMMHRQSNSSCLAGCVQQFAITAAELPKTRERSTSGPHRDTNST